MRRVRSGRWAGRAGGYSGGDHRSTGLRVRGVSVRPGSTVVVAIAASIVLGLAAGVAEANRGEVDLAAAPIYMYANIGNSIPGTTFAPNTPLVRPSTLLVFEDGSWAIVKLRWTGWGASVARATGISSSSTCKPDCASGPRINRPAQLVVSHPERLFGRRVYGCFQLTVPSYPKSDQHDCIGHLGNTYGYVPASSATTSPVTTKTVVGFYTPSRNISCVMTGDGVFCDMGKPPALASLAADGVATICQHQGLKCTGNFGEGPVFRQLSYGSSKTVGRFRCTSALSGVTCIVSATGKGFFISRQLVKSVG